MAPKKSQIFLKLRKYTRVDVYYIWLKMQYIVLTQKKKPHQNRPPLRPRVMSISLTSLNRELEIKTYGEIDLLIDCPFKSKWVLLLY